MRIEVLGCSGGFGPGHDTTALLLNESILIDAGTGIGNLEPEQMLRIEHVVLTHAHLDHVCALPLLQVTIVNRNPQPLTLYGSEETLSAVHTHILNNSIWPDFTQIPSGEEPMIRLQKLEPEQPTAIGDCRFEMIEVNHTIPAFGFRVSSHGKTMAFTGDTTTTDRFWQVLNQAPLDLLIAEVAFSNENDRLGRISKHYTPELLAADLGKLEHRPQLAISHMQPNRGQRIMGQIATATGREDLIRLKNGQVLKL